MVEYIRCPNVVESAKSSLHLWKEGEAVAPGWTASSSCGAPVRPGGAPPGAPRPRRPPGAARAGGEGARGGPGGPPGPPRGLRSPEDCGEGKKTHKFCTCLKKSRMSSATYPGGSAAAAPPGVAPPTAATAAAAAAAPCDAADWWGPRRLSSLYARSSSISRL